MSVVSCHTLSAYDPKKSKRKRIFFLCVICPKLCKKSKYDIVRWNLTSRWTNPFLKLLYVMKKETGPELEKVKTFFHFKNWELKVQTKLPT